MAVRIQSYRRINPSHDPPTGTGILNMYVHLSTINLRTGFNGTVKFGQCNWYDFA